MSLNDHDNFFKIQVKISKMTVFYRRKHLNEHEKQYATRASMGDLGSVLTWVAWVTYLRGWCGSVGSVLAWLAWVAWMACWCGWRASVCSVGRLGGVFAWMACQRWWFDWRANVSGMFLLLLLLILKYYTEKQNVKGLPLKQK